VRARKWKLPERVEHGSNKYSECDVFRHFLDCAEGPADKARRCFVEFRRSGVTEVLKLIEEVFPLDKTKLSNETSFKKKYRYVQVYYGERRWFVYHLGNEDNQWKGKLYSVAFTIKLADTRLPELETPVFEWLEARYGPPMRKEKFQYGGGSVSDDLELHIWDLPFMVVQYRGLVDSDGETVMVVEYWDRLFYKEHSYCDY